MKKKINNKVFYFIVLKNARLTVIQGIMNQFLSTNRNRNGFFWNIHKQKSALNISIIVFNFEFPNNLKPKKNNWKYKNKCFIFLSNIS